MEKKKHVDYLVLIDRYGYNHEFSLYCKKHQKINLRRNARNFLLVKGHYKDLKELRKVGFYGNVDWMIKIAKTPWLK